jgi:hypothetical protein
MLTNNLIIELCCDRVDADVTFAVRDRKQILIESTPFNNLCQSCNFNLEFPNTLFIDVTSKGPEAVSIEIKSITLGGLKLSDKILNQICIFKPLDSNDSTVTRNLFCPGIVSIDFFAQDWIQYHLLYGSKIK